MAFTLTNYLYIWQLPLLLVFFIAWIFGGGYLLRWSIRRRELQLKSDLGHCTLAITLAGIAGGISGAIIFLLFNAIGKAAGAGVSMIIVGLIFGAAATVVIAYLVIYAMFATSARNTLLICIPPIGGILLLALVVLLAGALPARYMFLRKLDRDRSLGVMQRLAYALTDYQRESQRTSPSSVTVHLPEQLEALVEDGRVTPRFVRPDGPDKPPRFFYLRPASGVLPKDTQALVACEMKPHSGGRAVLVGHPEANCESQWRDDQDFRRLLDLPQNKAFAEAFRAAAVK